MFKQILLATVFSFVGLLTIHAQSLEGDGPHSQLIIRGVMLINGNGAPPQGPIDIVVENNIIKDIKVL
jgi:hypothetical protein